MRRSKHEKLDDLIEELCPNGVNYVQLNQFSKIYDGTHNTPQYTNYGVKFVSVENINDLYNTSKYISEEDYESIKSNHGRRCTYDKNRFNWCMFCY